MQDLPRRPMHDWLPLPSFMTELVIGKVRKKRLFGGSYVQFTDFDTGCKLLFCEGAVIGRAKRDKFDLLAYALFDYERANRNLGVATDPLWLKGWVKDNATESLKRYRNLCGELPTGFQQFVSGLIYQDRGAVYPRNEYHLLTMGPGELDRNYQRINELLKSKVPIEIANLEMLEWCLMGFGFGFKYPDLMARLYENEVSVDTDRWTKYRNASLRIPETPSAITLSEFEGQMFALMAIYATTYYPAMLQTLDLAEHLPAEYSF